MQFQVPQFIEIEDRVVGPLTIKQFIYLAGGMGICTVAYIFIKPLFLALFIILPVAALSASLAFVKINNKNFVQILEAAFYYALRKKLYIWKKQERMPEKRGEESANIEGLFAPRMSESKLKDLAWSLDINERIGKREKLIK